MLRVPFVSPTVTHGIAIRATRIDEQREADSRLKLAPVPLACPPIGPIGSLHGQGNGLWFWVGGRHKTPKVTRADHTRLSLAPTLVHPDSQPDP